MIGHVGGNCPYAFAIKLSDALLPIAVTVLGPLKRKLDDSPGFAKERGCFQRRAQYHALQLRLIRLPGGAAQWKIEKYRPRRLKRHAGLPKGAHAQRGQSSCFERSCDQSDGPMTRGSERKQKKQIDTLLLEFSMNRRHGLLQQVGKCRDRADHRDGPRRQAADCTFGFEIGEPLSRKRNV